MLKITVSSQVFIADEILAANKVGGIKSRDELIEKYGKLSKTRKLFKFQKLSKSEKKLSKSGNLLNFNAKKNGPSFLTPNAKTTFNFLTVNFY